MKTFITILILLVSSTFVFGQFQTVSKEIKTGHLICNYYSVVEKDKATGKILDLDVQYSDAVAIFTDYEVCISSDLFTGCVTHKGRVMFTGIDEVSIIGYEDDVTVEYVYHKKHGRIKEVIYYFDMGTTVTQIVYGFNPPTYPAR